MFQRLHDISPFNLGHPVVDQQRDAFDDGQENAMFSQSSQIFERSSRVATAAGRPSSLNENAQNMQIVDRENFNEANIESRERSNVQIPSQSEISFGEGHFNPIHAHQFAAPQRNHHSRRRANNAAHHNSSSSDNVQNQAGSREQSSGSGSGNFNARSTVNNESTASLVARQQRPDATSAERSHNS